MATTALRPMSTGEILDASFALLRHHAGVFFGIAIICQGVPTALSLYVEFAGGASQHFGLYAAGTDPQRGGLPRSCPRRPFAWSRRPTSGMIPAWPTRSTSRSASSVGRCSPAWPQASLSCSRLLLFVIPGIVVACGLAVAVQAAVLEPLNSGLDGVGRSWTLTRGFKWRAFGLYCVVLVLFILFVLGFGNHRSDRVVPLQGAARSGGDRTWVGVPVPLSFHQLCLHPLLL